MTVDIINMQAAVSSDHFQTPRPTSSDDNITNSIRPDIKRAMSTPNLSISIPPMKSKFMAKKGDVVLEESDEDSEAELTAASSICHSPGWDDAVTKKQKKEKEEAKKRKKKEAEKAAAKALAQAKADAKQAEKEKRNRLSKVNPANNTSRFSRLGMMMNRSSSMPMVPLSKDHSTSSSEAMATSLTLERPTFSTAQSAPKVWTDITSNSEQRSAITASPVPQSTQAGSPLLDDHSHEDKRTSSADEIDQKYRHVDASMSQIAHPHATVGTSVSSTSETMDRNPLQQSTSTDETLESERTSEQWESIYERAASLMRSSQSKDRSKSRSRDASTTSNGGRKLRKKSYPPATQHPACLDQGYTSRPSSSSRTSRDVSRRRASNEHESGNRPTTGYCSEQRERSGSAHSELYSERDTSQRRDSQARSGQSRERQQSRGRRLSLTSVKNFIRSPSPNDATSKIAAVDLGVVEPPPSREPRSRPASRSHIIGSPSESGLHQRRSSSKSNLPGEAGLRHTAKSTSNGKVQVTSAADRELDAVHIRSISNGTNQHSRHASSTSSAPQRSSKLERFFGQPVTAQLIGSPVDSQSPSTINTLSPAPSVEPRSHDSAESLGTQQSGMVFSEGVVTEDSSAITTPMQASTELYKEESQSEAQHNDYVYNIKSEHDQDNNDSYMMTSAVRGSVKPPGTPHPGATAPISDSPTIPAIPQRSLGRPTSPLAESINDSMQVPAPLRSISTPELSRQDLSFLPVLKHQPLPKSNKHASVTMGVRPGEKTTQDQNRLSTPARTQQKPVSENRDVLKTPLATNYLQQARLSISSPLRSASGLPKAGATVDPIAKMFVVCCACKYYHDMPSKIYECMAKSDNVVEDKDLGVHGVISTSVRCPWCNHGMTTQCCAGYAAVVILKERLH